jgi:hypothetical protein
MVGMPYLLLAVFVFIAYRGYRKLRQMDALYENPPPGPEGAGSAPVGFAPDRPA